MPAKLTVVRGKRLGTELPLDGKAVFDLGSAPTAALRFEDAGVAANHCRIFREDKKFTIFDLCGLGVSVNGQRVARSVLKHGDEVTVGQLRLRFEDSSGASTSGSASPVAAAGAGGPVAAGGVTASLHCIDGADKGKVWALSPEKSSFTVGRGMTAEVVVLDIKCSREHCRVERREDGYYLVDLGSTNGTKINGKKVKPSSTTKLAPGDQLKLGYSVLALRVEGEVALPETTKMKGATEGLVPAAPPAPGMPARAPVTAGLPPTAKHPHTPAPPPAVAPSAEKVDLDFDFIDNPTEEAPRPVLSSAPSAPPPPPAPAPTAAAPPEDPEEAAEASLRTFVFDDAPSFDEPKQAEKPAPKPAKPAPPSVDRMAQTAPETRKHKPDLMGTFFFEDEPAFPDKGSSDEKPAPPPPPPPRPPAPAAKAPKPPEGEDAALRTFVFDDAPGFDEGVPAPPPPPAAPAAKKPAAPPAAAKPPAPPADEDEDEDEGQDAAIRTFVFDDAPSFDEPAPKAKPAIEPAPKAAPAPPPPAPPAKKAAAPVEDDSDEEPRDPALRTFVFDDAPSFDEAPPKATPKAASAPPPPPAPAPKAKPAIEPAPKPAPAAKAAPAPPPPAPPARKAAAPVEDDSDEEPRDPALRTFVFDDAPSFDEAPPKATPKAASAPSPPPAPAPRKTSRIDDTDESGEDSDEEPRDPALRTFVFDDAPSFDDGAPAAAPPPPPPALPKGTTARYQAEDEPSDEEPRDPALRTFVFDDTPSFDPKSESDEKASFRRVDVDVPDFDAPAEPPKTAKAPPATPRTPAADEDEEDDRPPEFKTQFIMNAKDLEAAADAKKPEKPDAEPGDDEDGEHFRTLVFDKPPQF